MSIHQITPPQDDTSRIQFVASATGSGNATTFSLTVPAAAQAGDLAIYNLATDTTTSFTYPAGWTFLQSSFASSAKGATIAKILSASDVGATVTIIGDGGSDPFAGVMLIFRGFQNFKFFTAKSLNIESTSGNPALQTVTSSADNGKSVIVVGSTSGRPTGQNGAFVSTSPAFDATITSASLRVGYSIYNKGTTVVNHTVDMNDVGQNILQSFYMIFQ
jgi:hypothetical protein